MKFDDELQIEAYQFIGVSQKFPNHFHDYYVIGLIEAGQRILTVNQQEYHIGPGDLLTFNPQDKHSCEQTDQYALSYRCLNIKPDIWEGIAREISGHNISPYFCQPVQYQTEFAHMFRELHDMVVNGINGLEKEELFLLFMDQLIITYAAFNSQLTMNTVSRAIEDVCEYLEAHYAENLSLDMLGKLAGLNKYTLLRTFTRQKSITPYRYLETIRIGKAKELLEQGQAPAAVAQSTGFADQSHFTRFFNQLIGLTPGQYQAIFRKDVN